MLQLDNPSLFPENRVTHTNHTQHKHMHKDRLASTNNFSFCVGKKVEVETELKCMETIWIDTTHASKNIS